MNQILHAILSAMTIHCFTTANSQKIPATSPQATISQTIGISEVTITYSRPSVKGREIWGSLVPFGYNNPRFSINPDDGRPPATAPWRVGANMAPRITFSHDAVVQGQAIKAGSYAILLAVFEDKQADFILSSNSSQFGSVFYDENDVVLKAKVDAEQAPFTEQMRFAFDSVTTSYAQAALYWESLKFPFSIEINTTEITYNELLKSEDTQAAITNGNWYANAAIYLMNNQVYLDKALIYIKNAANGYNLRSFPNLSTYANILAMQGKPDEAEEILNEAFADPNAIGINTLRFYGNQTLSLNLPDYALRTYNTILASFPDNEWVAYNGLANAYSKKEEYKNAAEALKEAREHAPENYDMSQLEEKLALLRKRKPIN